MSSGITPSHHHTLIPSHHHTLTPSHCTMFACLSLQPAGCGSHLGATVGLLAGRVDLRLGVYHPLSHPQVSGLWGGDELSAVTIIDHLLSLPNITSPPTMYISDNSYGPSPSTHAHIHTSLRLHPPPPHMHTCSPESQHPLVNTTTVAPDPSPSSQRHSLRNEFEQEVQDILYSGGVRESVPRLRRHTGEGQQEYSQQECFRFLSHSIEQLTTRFLLRQQRAKARLKQRCRTGELAVTPQSIFICPQSISYVPSPFHMSPVHFICPQSISYVPSPFHMSPVHFICPQSISYVSSPFHVPSPFSFVQSIFICPVFIFSETETVQ